VGAAFSSGNASCSAVGRKWRDGTLSDAGRERGGSDTPRMLLEFTDGARRPGSVSNIASAPGTSFAYDQKLGGVGHLLVAGR